MYVVSGCLLGQNCKYNGGNNKNDDVIEFCKTHKYVVVCPESAGNLEKPRPPAEKVGNRILNQKGEDVTEAFLRGAEISFKTCMEIARIAGDPIEGAILKANSPSCGCGQIYDGTFSGMIPIGRTSLGSPIKLVSGDKISHNQSIAPDARNIPIAQSIAVK